MVQPSRNRPLPNLEALQPAYAGEMKRPPWYLRVCGGVVCFLGVGQFMAWLTSAQLATDDTHPVSLIIGAVLALSGGGVAVGTRWAYPGLLLVGIAGVIGGLVLILGEQGVPPRESAGRPTNTRFRHLDPRRHTNPPVDRLGAPGGLTSAWVQHQSCGSTMILDPFEELIAKGFLVGRSHRRDHGSGARSSPKHHLHLPLLQDPPRS